MAAPILQEWMCPRCGRSRDTEPRQEQSDCESCTGPARALPDDAAGERRTVLVRLRKRYDEAREMASREEPHANLEWLIDSSERPGFEPPDIDGALPAVVPEDFADAFLEASW